MEKRAGFGVLFAVLLFLVCEPVMCQGQVLGDVQVLKDNFVHSISERLMNSNSNLNSKPKDSALQPEKRDPASVIEEIRVAIASSNVSQALEDITSEASENLQGIRQGFNWIRRTLPTEMGDKLVKEWKVSTRGGVLAEVWDAPNATYPNPAKNIFWNFLDDVHEIMFDPARTARLANSLTNATQQCRTHHTQLTSNGNSLRTDKVLASGMFALVSATDVTELATAFKNIQNAPVNISAYIVEANATSVPEEIEDSTASRILHFVMCGPAVAELLTMQEFQNRLDKRSSWNVPEAAASNVTEPSTEDSIASFLETSSTLAPTRRVMIMLMLAAGCVCGVMMQQLYELEKPDLRIITNTKLGMTKVVVLMVGTILALAEMITSIYAALRESNMSHEMKGDLEFIQGLVNDANERRIQKKFAYIQKDELQLEKTNDDQTLEDPQTAFERKKFDELFHVTEHGARASEISAFLLHNGVPDGEVRDIISGVNPATDGYVTFDEFHSNILHPSSQENVFAAHFAKSESRMKYLLFALLVIVVDGSNLSMMAVIIALASFLVSMSLGYFASPHQSHSAAVQRQRTLLAAFSLVKIVVGCCVLILIMMVSAFSIYCKTPELSCPSIMTQAFTAPEPACLLHRNYFDYSEMCNSSAIKCTWGGLTEWVLPEVAIRPELKDYVMSLDSSFSTTWSDAQIRTRLKFSHKMTTNTLCLAESQPSNLPTCVIYGPSNQLVTLEDGGANSIDETNNSTLTLYTQKDVFFVPWVGGSCNDVPDAVATVNPRGALSNDVEFYLPAVQNQTVTVMMLYVPDTPMTTNFYRMCQRPNTRTRTGSFAAQNRCVYVFGQPTQCSSPNCDDADFTPVATGSFSDLFYFSAISHLTVGFGDISPVSLRARMTAFVEGVLEHIILLV
eukprot:c10612_g1_i1.p1 GENE.c10612_g1_i1~~c10612_g1_i1.p1  ORF type:complete len:925 (-),score=280.64 c10612_g1_i1:3151-5865(-)